MNHDARTEAPTERPSFLAPPTYWPPAEPGVLLGSYATPDGRRELRALPTQQHGLCLVDEGPGQALLVEPNLAGIDEAQAIAVDYLELAREQGAPQTRHLWPPTAHEDGAEDARERS
jgi:hypothetical protein